MTLIAGYIYKNSVHILADSAETFSIQGIKDITFPEIYKNSFQEVPFVDTQKETLVLESANKIYNIKNQILLTYSGAVNEGEDVVKQIRYNLERQKIRSVSQLIFSCLTDISPIQTQYIIGGMENNRPFLIVYYNKVERKIMVNNNSLAVGGANVGLQTSMMSTIINCITNDKITPEESLIMNLAALQSGSMHLQTFNHGVGGFFNGASISKDGIKWAKDTIHLLYSSHDFERGNKHLVYRYNRDNNVHILNDQFYKCFVKGGDGVEICKKVKTKLKKDIIRLAKRNEAEYFVMLSYDTRTIVIVSNKKDKNKIINFDNKEFQFGIPNDIMKHMFKYYHPNDFLDGNSPFYSYTNFLL